MVTNTVKECTFCPMAEFKRASGKKARDSTGLTTSQNKNNKKPNNNFNSLFNRSKLQRDLWSRQRQNSKQREGAKK